MYKTIRADKVIETVGKLQERIVERFPSSGLGKLCGELQDVAQQSKSRAAAIAKPNTAFRAAVSAAVCHLLGERGRSIHVLMAYSDAFEPLTRWYVQLAGESLGKLRGSGARAKPVGITPLAARGTTDQHSQVQLFVEGPADKLVTFLVAAETRPRLRVGGAGPAPYLAGVELGSLLRAEQRGTAVALARAGRPSTSWVMPRASAESLGQLMPCRRRSWR